MAAALRAKCLKEAALLPNRGGRDEVSSMIGKKFACAQKERKKC